VLNLGECLFDIAFAGTGRRSTWFGSGRLRVGCRRADQHQNQQDVLFLHDLNS